MTAAKLANTTNTNTATVNRKKKYIEEMYFGPLFALVGKIFLSKVLETVLKTTMCKIEIQHWEKKTLLARQGFPIESSLVQQRTAFPKLSGLLCMEAGKHNGFFFFFFLKVY